MNLLDIVTEEIATAGTNLEMEEIEKTELEENVIHETIKKAMEVSRYLNLGGAVDLFNVINVRKHSYECGLPEEHILCHEELRIFEKMLHIVIDVMVKHDCIVEVIEGSKVYITTPKFRDDIIEFNVRHSNSGDNKLKQLIQLLEELRKRKGL